MTDLEITKLCAEVMGIDHKIKPDNSGYWMPTWGNKLGSHVKDYDPLHDDAQAMALVKRGALMIMPPYSPGNGTLDWAVNAGLAATTYSKDLNRAICECVARMMEAKRGNG